jgi:terminase, large subunit
VHPRRRARDLDEEFFAQMTQERLVVRRQGFTEWESPRRRARPGCASSTPMRL